MNPSHFPPQQNYYIPTQSQQPIPHQMFQQDPNVGNIPPNNYPGQPFHMGNNQNFQNAPMPTGQAYQPMPNNEPVSQDPSSNQNPRILMALNYLQSHLMGNSGFNMGNQSQGYNMVHNPNFPMQQGYPGNMDSNSYQQGYNHGSSPNKFKQHSGYRDDRGDRRDRDSRERSDRGDRRGYNVHDGGRGKRTDSFIKDRKPIRRSRSRSRSFERRDSGNRKGSYNNNSYNNRDKQGDRRHNDRDGFRSNNQQRGNQVGAQKPGDASDWRCIGCGNVNWARRQECNRCKAKRTENAPLVPKDSNGRSNSIKGGFDNKHTVNNYKQANNFKDPGNNNRGQQEEGRL